MKLGIGAVAATIVCCAGLPAILTLLGGLTLGAILGLGLGVLVVGAVVLTATRAVTRSRLQARSGQRSERG